jgi:hypothetical protein
MLVEVEQGRVTRTTGLLHAIAHALGTSLTDLAGAARGHRLAGPSGPGRDRINGAGSCG